MSGFTRSVIFREYSAVHYQSLHQIAVSSDLPSSWLFLYTLLYGVPWTTLFLGVTIFALFASSSPPAGRGRLGRGSPAVPRRVASTLRSVYIHSIQLSDLRSLLQSALHLTPSYICILISNMAGAVRQPIDIPSLERYIDQNVPALKTPLDVKQVCKPRFDLTAAIQMLIPF